MSVVDNAFETKGTHLFFVDKSDSDEPVVKLTCPTGIPGIGSGSKSRIDTTCLDETGAYRKYVGGFAEAGEVAIPFILYKGDGSHQALFALRDGNQVIPVLVGLSDATSVPTKDTDGELVPPADRTCFTFEAYVSNLTIDVNTNEVVRGTLTLQPSGTTTPHWAA